MSKKMKKICFVAGGTGGHVFPALSLALKMKKDHPYISITWIGTDRSRENEFCKRYGIPFTELKMHGGLSRSSIIKNVKMGIELLSAIRSSREILRKTRPDAVLAFGGYTCAPVLAAAKLEKVPYFIQEQNSVPGLVNRLFSRGAVCSYLGFPQEGKKKIKGRVQITGTPIRPIVSDYMDFKYPEGFDRNRPLVLISGGSQGAVSMNDKLINAVRTVCRDDIQFVWQTGDVSFEKVNQEFKADDNVFVFNTIDDLYPYYACARCVVCRAGASTLSEISSFGIPCVMIPLPWAADNHQWINAGVVQSQGWGIRLVQEEIEDKKLVRCLKNLVHDRSIYEKMSQRALDNSAQTAAGLILDDIIKKCIDKR